VPRISGASYNDYLAWQLSQRERPLPKSHGIWCPHCKQSHPYNGPERNRLIFKSEKRGAHYATMWLCPRTNFVIGEITRRDDGTFSGIAQRIDQQATG
jgi:hypothetical protein